jgi:hypothetical protein
MRFAWLLSATLAVHAQVASPAVRGVVLERDSDRAGGEFSIRLDTYEVLVYRFDASTRVDRDNYPIAVPLLKPGEKVEVVSDALPGSPLRLARSVRVIGPLPDQASRIRHRTAYSGLPDPFVPTDPLFVRGDLAVSGIIARVNSGRLVLHTREGDRTILLRDDTRYLDNGSLATAAALRPNMRVFVRAGRNLYDEMEGFQVVWGSILEPK